MATRTISERTREQALKALDRMAEIVKNEMLIRGEYVSQDIEPSMSGSICGGRRYCAIGSLWAGAGVQPYKALNGWWILPGVMEHDGERAVFLRPRHGLRTAYDALNAAAEQYIEDHETDIPDWMREDFKAPIELLFEGGENIGRPELLEIIASARRAVRAA